MKKKWMVLTALTLTFAGTGLCRAADAQLDPETKARVDRFEKGPATIDVSKYPDGIKENYEVFSTKCSQCHKLSRPINSDYASPDEWSRYIKRMMHKPGSGISSADGKKIYEFLATTPASARKRCSTRNSRKPRPRKRPTPKPRSRKFTTSTIRSSPRTELECPQPIQSNCRT